MFRSITSTAMAPAMAAALANTSGSPPKSCRATGRSSAKTRARAQVFLSPRTMPMAETISVKTRLAPPDLAISRWAGLDIPAMGAAMKGCCNIKSPICMKQIYLSHFGL